MNKKLMAVNPGLAIAMLALVLLPGCASVMGVGKSEYACPGGAEGVRCLSARQIYQATNATDTVQPTKNGGKDTSGATKVTVPHTSQVAVPRIDQPVPIRTQAKVMRIWMAPWEDDDGDLHADGYLYTEIEERRWNLGERFSAPSSMLMPLSAHTPLPTR